MTRRTLPAGVILLLFLIAVLAGCAHEPDIVDVVLSQPRVKGEAQGRIELPIVFAAGVPLISAEIKEFGIRPLAYDTGAWESIITDRLIEEIGLEPEAVHKVRGRNERVKAEAYVLPLMRFGDLALKGVTAYRHEETDIEWIREDEGRGSVGILSWTVFNDYVVTIDYGRACLVLEASFPPADRYQLKPLLFEYGDFDRQSLHTRAISTIVTSESYSTAGDHGESYFFLPFMWRFGFVTIPATMDGVEKNLIFMLDTGSTLNWVRADLVDVASCPDVVDLVGKIKTVEGIQDLDNRVTQLTLHIGSPAVIHTEQAMILDEEDRFGAYFDTHWSNRIDGILGAPFLSKYAVTIDRRNRMVVLRPVESRPSGMGG